MKSQETESENKMAKKKIKSADNVQSVRPIDAVPQAKLRHTLRIEKADTGGYSLRHETSGNGDYKEKLHVAPDKKKLKEIIDRLV